MWNYKKNSLECSIEERISYHEVKRQNNSKYRNRRRIMSGHYDGKKRLKDFRWMCRRTLFNLWNGEIPKDTYNSYKSVINSFHLVEPELASYKIKQDYQNRQYNQDDKDDDDEDDSNSKNKNDKQDDYDDHDDHDDRDEQHDQVEEDDHVNQDDEDDKDE